MKMCVKLLLCCGLGLGAISCNTSPSPSGEGGGGTPENGGAHTPGGVTEEKPRPVTGGGAQLIPPPPPPPLPADLFTKTSWRDKAKEKEKTGITKVVREVVPPLEKPQGAMTLTAEMLKKRLQGMRGAHTGDKKETPAPEEKRGFVLSSRSHRGVLAPETQKVIRSLVSGDQPSPSEKENLQTLFQKNEEKIYNRILEGMASSGGPSDEVLAYGNYKSFLDLKNPKFSDRQNRKRVKSFERELKDLLGQNFSAKKLREGVESFYKNAQNKLDMLFSYEEEDSSDDESWSQDD